jgi:hypothetical protein
MQIQAGKYYRRRDGQVTGPVILRSGETYRHVTGGYSYTPNGEYNVGATDDRDLIAEVTVTDVLPFELKAGGKYCTVKPDGSEGPVVTLRRPSYSAESLYRAVPFTANYEGKSHFVKSCGEVFSYDGTEFHITAPYVEPKPPTIAERLEKWGNQLWSESVAEELHAIIADLKDKESKP